MAKVSHSWGVEGFYAEDLESFRNLAGWVGLVKVPHDLTPNVLQHKQTIRYVATATLCDIPN